MDDTAPPLPVPAPPAGACRPPTARWSEVEAAAPELAAAVLARFTAARHHVLATLTRDGSPRVSGTELTHLRGDLLLGSMTVARKVADLRRDPRFALHAHTGDGSMADGDAKVSGLAEEVQGEELERSGPELDAPGPFHLFRLHLASVVLTELHGDGLRITSFRPGSGLSVVHRGP